MKIFGLCLAVCVICAPICMADTYNGDLVTGYECIDDFLNSHIDVVTEVPDREDPRLLEMTVIFGENAPDSKVPTQLYVRGAYDTRNYEKTIATGVIVKTTSIAPILNPFTWPIFNRNSDSE